MYQARYRPTVFWAWNGEMERSEIREQIKGFADNGIGGVFIHARAGLGIPYLGEEWFAAYRFSVQCCEAAGIDVWIYDEFGWPSGFAGGAIPALGEDYCLKHLVLSDRSAASPARTVAAYKTGANGKELTTFEEGEFFVCWETQRHYVDLLSGRVTEAFIKSTHERYREELGKYFGKTIRGVFTDEPQVHCSSQPWSVALADAFYACNGYDALPLLYLLFEKSRESEAFRHDYYKTVSKLFVENFTMPLAAWCEQNGLIFTGHFAAEDSLCTQCASNGGVMPHYRYMQQPGIDFLGRRLNPALLMKQVCSVKNQFGKERVLSESFACTGPGVTFAQLAWLWGYQASFGVDMACMSISMYTLSGIRKRDYPVYLSYQQPWWNEFKYLTQWMTGLTGALAQGESLPEVAVLSAVTSGCTQPFLSRKQKMLANQYRILLEGLMDIQIEYDVVDETLLAEFGEVKNGSLMLEKGRYGILIVPELISMEQSSLDLIEKFLNAGGRVYFANGLPSLINGRAAPEIISRLEARCASFVVQNRAGMWRKLFASLHFRRRVEFRSRQGSEVAKGLAMNVRQCQNDTLCYVVNCDLENRKKLTAVFAGNGIIGKLDPVTDAVTALDTVQTGEYCYADMELAPMESALLKLNAGEKSCLLRVENTARRLEAQSVSCVSENCLTVDVAEYAVEDGAFSLSTPIVRVQNEAYREAAKYPEGCMVRLRYRFRCEEVTGIDLAAETATAEGIWVNGTDVSDRKNGWFLDKKITRYSLNGAVISGENVVEIAYRIRPLAMGFDINAVHETERNKFSYPAEMESVYVIGNFNVSFAGRVWRYPDYYRLEAGAFTLTRYTEKRADRELLEQGMWFYAGNTEYVYPADMPASGKAMLELDNLRAAAVTVRVNGEEAGCIMIPPYRLDISRYLHAGSNTIVLTLANSLRNVLGPHHHFKGEPQFVGVHTYTGEYGNGSVEDLSSAEQPDRVWSDDYHFAPIGPGTVRLIGYTEKVTPPARRDK